MSLAKALNDVRKMKRSIRLRGESDPEVVASALDSILKESIAVKSADSGLMGKGAMNELRNLRSDLIARQLDAGSRTGELISKMSMVLDEMESIEADQQSAERSGQVKSMVSAVTASIPSAQTITSAMITANPILGYSAKIVMDMISARRQQKANAQAEAKKRMSILKQQETSVEQQLKTEEEKQNQIKDEESSAQSSSNTGESSSSSQRIDDYHQELRLIRDEIQQLNQIIAKTGDLSVQAIETSSQDVQKTTITSLQPISEAEQSQLHRLDPIEAGVNNTFKQTEAVREATEETSSTNKERLRMEVEREQQNQFNTLEADREKGAQDATSIGVNRGEKGFGLGGMSLFGRGALGGTLLGGMAGLAGGMLSKIFAPFQAIIRFFTKGASVFGKFARGNLLVATVMTIYDFVDGFFSAGDILGKDDVSFTERLKVGAANVISGLLAPIDWIAEFFGGDLYEGSQDDLTKRIAEGFSGFVTDTIDQVKSTITSVFDTVMDKITSINDRITKWVEDTFTSWIPDFLKGDEELQSRSNESFQKGGAMAQRELDQRKQQKLEQEDQRNQLRVEETPVKSPTNQAAEAVERSTSSSNGAGDSKGSGNVAINAPSNNTTVNNNTYRSGSLNSSNNEPGFVGFRRSSYGILSY